MEWILVQPQGDKLIFAPHPREVIEMLFVPSPTRELRFILDFLDTATPGDYIMPTPNTFIFRSAMPMENAHDTHV